MTAGRDGTAQTISEWLKKQMGAGGIPAHNMKAHSFSHQLWVAGVIKQECASSCDVRKRDAAPADAKTRKSAE